MSRKYHKDIGPLVKAAVAQGFTVSKTGGGHLKFTSTTGAIVFCASTPSDWRAVANIRSDLRRAGLKI